MLARVLSQEDIGLVGAVLIFQAFASLLIDSGFSYALIQRKEPSRLDYSTVLWFNLGVSVLLYAVLALCAPLIARCFQNDIRLIPLIRVMTLSIIINASFIVQINRLMKAMDVRMVAVSNSIGLILGGVTGIALAISGAGPWAIVWQTIVTGAARSLILWTTSAWRPMMSFSWTRLRLYFGLGSRMMLTSFLNTLFLNIYSFVIGNRNGMTALGYYTQSDKWSKMGITSITQVLTSSFLPALSAVQDDAKQFAAMVSKTNRFTCYILFPAILGLMLMAKPIFHTLFGTKWDPSIILFQLLLLRGIFTVLMSLYNNYIISLGHGGIIVRLEIIRDAAALIALAITFPYMTLATSANPVRGLEIMLWAQAGASALTYMVSLAYTVRFTRVPLRRFMLDMLPYFAQTMLIIPIMSLAASTVDDAWLQLTLESVTGLALYIGGNYIFKSKIQRGVFDYIRGRDI